MRPNWSGFMQLLSSSPNPFQPSADVRMLPIIDLNPNNMSCMYSTLLFIEKEARNLNMPTACVTFDQPLWLKAVDIVHAMKMNIVCRLGGFHVIMSFLGSIGHIMECSGLVEALQCCYGPVAISHMMSGKAVARSLRGHYLVESAMHSLLLQSIFNPSPDNSEAVLNETDIEELWSLYKDITTLNVTLQDENLPDCIQKLNIAISSRKLALSTCRTASLWLQYMYYVKILKLFITAE